MMVYPKVQRRAQEEIDRVIGSDRLPTFADRGSLPYVEAVAKELLRWNPVTPLGTSTALGGCAFLRCLEGANCCEQTRSPTRRE